MKFDLIQSRLETYNPSSKVDEENAYKEICQEIALSGLSRAGFFKKALFQGGTCLRIIYGLRRFSEDLDFILIDQNQAFSWGAYLQSIMNEFEAFGLSLDTKDRSKANSTIKKAFLKEDSFGQILELRYPRSTADKQKITIKLEIDTSPPMGSVAESHYLNYPYPFSISTQDMSSLFAGKCHALLCREYVKGRDWFDFLWYVQHKTPVNFQFLQNALEQSGPFASQKLTLSKETLASMLHQKIDGIDWVVAVKDIERFIPQDTLHTLQLWNKEFFQAMLKKVEF